MISVNATDLAGGSAFAFNQTSFDLLCSDLSTFPVSRAVAASAAFPILFTPITLTSYRRDCIGHPPPGAPGMALLREGAPLSRATALARDAARKMDPDRTQYVHLMDGGIADNLALRTLSNALVALDSDAAELRRLARVTRRIVVISVDGQAVVDPDIGQRRVVSGFGQIISAVSGSQIDAYSFETLLLLDTQVKDLTQKFRELRCAEAPMINGYPCDDVQGGLVQVSLRNVADPELRRRLQAVATSFTIPDADVDALVDQGSELIRTNPQLRDLLSEFLVKPQVVAAAAGPRQSDH
jgi:NTE family protein